jgi:hypothetical protein
VLLNIIFVPFQAEDLAMPFRDEQGPRSLSSSLNQKLNAYTLSASAAGVALLAVVPARAEIVYTATNVQFNIGVANIDFNHDGVDDIRITASSFAYHSRRGSVIARTPKTGAAVGHNQVVSALSSGFAIGPTAHFGANNGIMAKYFGIFYGGIYEKGSEGYWRNATNKYVGVRFLISGQTHYGWVRITVSDAGNGYNLNITGFAYETIANQAITAGQTSGVRPVKSELNPADLPAAAHSGPTLGMLAGGALGQPLWRREPELNS